MYVRHIGGVIQKTLLVCAVFLLAFPWGVLHAQELPQKIYSYDSVIATITLNNDSTFDVEERLTYRYAGVFHRGLRNISLARLGAITDISVVDGETERALQYVSEKLDKEDPKSWSKFTYFKEEGNQNIEWYYSLADTTHEWIIRYKVHGGIAFLKDQDRFYWSVFSGYDVPVVYSKATIITPSGTDVNKVVAYAYRGSKTSVSQLVRQESGAFVFEANEFVPKEAFTVDVGLPKGSISQVAYWVDFFKLYTVYIVSIFAILISFLVGCLYWVYDEKLRRGRGVIVPEYEPPRRIKPLIAEVVMRGKLTNGGLAATIIDLAVRGFVRIEEQDARVSSGRTKEYTLHLVKAFQNDPLLEAHEKAYLNILFPQDITSFSTEAMKKCDNEAKRAMSVAVEAFKTMVYGVIDRELGIFETGIETARKKMVPFAVLSMFLIFFLAVFFPPTVAFTSAALLSILFCAVYIKYKPRRSREGRILKEELLGFKLYLETAERYRLQNLTPDLFEKYLPYAMIFGVEKGWAKAFEGLSMSSPSWYSDTLTVVNGSTSSSFFPAEFGGSFSTSVSSAFASAIGVSSEGSAGSGRAGGGGGGGGGGAD